MILTYHFDVKLSQTGSHVPQIAFLGWVQTAILVLQLGYKKCTIVNK